MEKRLFFLSKDGWFEAELTRKLMFASDEELVRWACVAMDRLGYRNYMITENPHYAIKGRARTVLFHETCTMPLHENNMKPLHETVMHPVHEAGGIFSPAGRHAS